MSLRHIVIPSWPNTKPPRYPTYALATRVQSKLQQDLLSWKAKASSSTSSSSAAPPPPFPALISFTPAPTYTLGRRQTEPLPDSERARLQRPLHILPSPSSSSSSSSSSSVNNDDADSNRTYALAPSVLHAPRGGLTTYHGPGQVVLWPVMDLHSPLHARFGVREYTCLLEKTTIATLRRLYGIEGFTTDNPGVWVMRRKEQKEEKISALGVHLRRHVTGLGVAVNLAMPVSGPEVVNPWARIVACGLGDRSVTSVAAQLGVSSDDDDAVVRSGEEIASVWAAEFADRLKIHASNSSSSSREGKEAAAAAAVTQEDWGFWERELQDDRADEGFVEAVQLQT
ncbi:hypothetical protein M426DRAFT_250800 [Hypoxylon sp. CI-4A]|nr:hypothetical protein M426DRAFT_250800 [Hypoxylon sp. CI-4A]